MIRVMLVDDDENTLKSMRRLLLASPEGYTIETFTHPAEALKQAGQLSFDVVIADFRMPEMDGADFLERFRAIQPDAYRVILSGFHDAGMLRNAINRAHVHRFIEKPSDGYFLEAAIGEGARHARLMASYRAQQAVIEHQTQLLETIAAAHPQALPAGWRDDLAKLTGHRQDD